MTEQTSKAVKVTIRGTVQGVGLRYRVRWAAEDQDLTGWVRNEADGTVAIHVEGVDHRIKNFLDWLRGGVDGAKITRIETAPTFTKKYTAFEVIP